MAEPGNLAALAESEALADAAPIATREWPMLAPDALHGLAGEFVRQIGPHTESDPVGILSQILLLYGNLIGRHSYFAVEADRHFLNLFEVQVGETSKGRRGPASDRRSGSTTRSTTIGWTATSSQGSRAARG